YRGLADGVSNYPYMQLADANGNPLTLDILPFKDSYIEGLADGRLLDWSYVPLQELGDSKKIQVNDELAANFNMEYTFPFGLRATTLYSYLKNNNPITELRGLGSYVTRHDINYFASWDARQVYWNMPVGDQLIEQFWNSNSHQGR